MQAYETEATIRQKITHALRSKRVAAKQVFDPAELESPEYQKWIADRIEDARRAKRLLTPQQYADLQQGRPLQQGDRARYVGPDRLETSPTTGKLVLRPHGQTGAVVRTERGIGRVIFTFLPTITAQTKAAAQAGADVEVLMLQTAEWVDLERIP